MTRARPVKFVLAAAVLLLSLAGVITAAQAPAGPQAPGARGGGQGPPGGRGAGRGQAAPEWPSTMANPYRMVEKWPTFGDIRSGAAIGIIPDGKGGTWI